MPPEKPSRLAVFLGKITRNLAIDKYRKDRSQKITKNEATEALMNGKYFSSVPNDYIRNGSIVKENIAKTELVYRNNREKYYQPYYKYYVELDPEALNMADDLKNYGIFYIPAIESEYLEEYKPNIEFN